MNFNQWVIEMRNNALMLSNDAINLSLRADKITKPDIQRLYRKVKALDQAVDDSFEHTSFEVLEAVQV